MIQIKLTDAQFWDLFNALYEAERSCERSAREAKCFAGSEWLIEENKKEAHKYEDLRRFITENQEVVI